MKWYKLGDWLWRSLVRQEKDVVGLGDAGVQLAEAAYHRRVPYEHLQLCDERLLLQIGRYLGVLAKLGEYLFHVLLLVRNRLLLADVRQKSSKLLTARKQQSGSFHSSFCVLQTASGYVTLGQRYITGLVYQPQLDSFLAVSDGLVVVIEMEPRTASPPIVTRGGQISCYHLGVESDGCVVISSVGCLDGFVPSFGSI